MKHMKGVEPTTAETSSRKKRLLFDHPIIAQIVMVALDLAVVTAIYFAMQRAGIQFEGQAERLSDAAVAILAALLVTAFYLFHFRHEFDGIFGWSNLGLALVIPVLAFMVTNVFDFSAMKFVFQIPGKQVNSVPLCLALALVPGIFEELLFRGIPVSNWMRTAEDGDTIMRCAWITSILFGLMHGTNALSGAAITSTVYQVFYSICIGLFFCAVFLRTGSIWPTIIAHTLIDLTFLMVMDIEKGGLITEELVIGLDFYITLGINVVLVLLSLWMLRKSKRNQILQLWSRKWHKADIEE